MFYAQFVLSKKGPLAKIWLAAHWEKKLSKAQVFETNVQEAVDELMHPKVKMALRTTGHLLLGIVRIYSRRAKYLLEDCNAAYLKVNSSFSESRRGIDDSDSQSLPEIVNFDAQLPEFNDIELPTVPPPINQSRIDDITLREDNAQTSDMPAFGDDFGGMDDFGEACLGEGFDVDEGELLERGRRAASELSNRMSVDHVTVESDKLDGISNAGDLDMLFANDDAPNGNMNDEVENVVESFQLEPLDQASVVNERVPKQRRRKRLLVDEVKNINGDEMKSNMADYSDIIQPLDLAPPTKKLLKIRETGTADKLYSLPGCNSIVDPVLIKVYQSHLIVHSKVPNELEAEVRRDLGMSDNIDEPERNFTPLEFDYDNNDVVSSPIQFAPIDEVDENVQPELDLPSPTKETEKRPRRSRVEKERVEESEEEDDEEHRCSKKTHAVASAIATKLKTSKTITLNDLLTKNATRKTAAQKFYALLELSKWEAIEVNQASPYGDIIIKEGSQMTQLLAN